jgi:hypothetical protein
LRAYFTKALAAFPGELGIEFLDVYEGVESTVVHFQARGRKGAELMEMNRGGLIHRALALAAEAAVKVTYLLHEMRDDRVQTIFPSLTEVPEFGLSARGDVAGAD